VRERERERGRETFGDANSLPATCIVDGGTTTSPSSEKETERERERERDTENFGNADPLAATCIVDGGATTYFYSSERETARERETFAAANPRPSRKYRRWWHYDLFFLLIERERERKKERKRERERERERDLWRCKSTPCHMYCRWWHHDLLLLLVYRLLPQLHLFLVLLALFLLFALAVFVHGIHYEFVGE